MSIQAKNVWKKAYAPSIHGAACELILSAIVKHAILANAAREHARKSMDSFLKRKGK